MEKISPAVVPTAALIAGVGTLVILLIMPKVDHITRETTDNSLATEESNSSKVSFFHPWFTYQTILCQEKTRTKARQ